MTIASWEKMSRFRLLEYFWETGHTFEYLGHCQIDAEKQQRHQHDTKQSWKYMCVCLFSFSVSGKQTLPNSAHIWRSLFVLVMSGFGVCSVWWLYNLKPEPVIFLRIVRANRWQHAAVGRYWRRSHGNRMYTVQFSAKVLTLDATVSPLSTLPCVRLLVV